MNTRILSLAARLLLLALLAAGCGSEPEDAGERSLPPAPSPAPPSTPLEPRGTVEGSDPLPGGSARAEEGAPRVVFVGTSLTAGYGLGDPLVESWPTRIGELAREAGQPIRVVNAGVSGDTSAGGRRRIGALLATPADLVVLELGANDGLRGLPIDQLRDNLGAVIDTVRARSPEARVLLIPMEAPRNLGVEHVGAFRSVYTELRARDRVTLAPFLLEGVAGDPDLNQADGIHPTAEGHRIMAATVWPALAPLLAEITEAERSGEGAIGGGRS